MFEEQRNEGFSDGALGRPHTSRVPAEPLSVERQRTRHVSIRVLRVCEPRRQHGTGSIHGGAVGVDEQRENRVIERSNRDLDMPLRLELPVERHDIAKDLPLLLQHRVDVPLREAAILLDEPPHRARRPIGQRDDTGPELMGEPREVEPHPEVGQVVIGEGPSLDALLEELSVAEVRVDLVMPVRVEERREQLSPVLRAQALGASACKHERTIPRTLLGVLLELLEQDTGKVDGDVDRAVLRDQGRHPIAIAQRVESTQGDRYIPATALFRSR